MIRRLIVGLGLLLSAAPAFAQCQSAAACATTPCVWNSAGSWTSGGGCTTPPDAAGESWVIQAGHTVNLDTATQTVGLGTINGTLYWDPSATARDGNGFRNLVVTTNGNDVGLTCGTGRIVLRPSDRLRFDTTAGRATFTYSSGCVLDFRGAATETTVGAVVPSDDGAGGTCGNGASTGRKWVITPASGLAAAKVGRRVIFRSGKLQTHHYEIAAVSGTDITLCSHLADGMSLGERLTPYGTANGGYIGAGTAGYHTTPEVTSAAGCTGLGAPYGCCTGAGTGCPNGPDPAVGDAFAIVDDYTINQSAGTAGITFVDAGDGTANCGGNPCQGMTTFPTLQYGNWSGLGSNTAAGNIAGQFVVRTANQFVPDVIGNNFHGWKSDYGFVFKGIKGAHVDWNAVHDTLLAAGSGDQYAQLNIHQCKTVAGQERCAVDTPAANLTVSHNIAWRTKQAAIQINDSSNYASETTSNYQASNIALEGNLIYGFCSVAGGNDCTGIHVHSCKGCRARYNVLFGGVNGGKDKGSGIKFGGSASDTGSDASFNFVVNMAGNGIRCDDAQGGGTPPLDAPVNLANTQTVAMVGNYVSNTKFAGGQGGNWWGNVVKNYALDNSAGSPGIINAITAKGGYVAVDSAVAAATVCTATANRCLGSALCYGVTDGDRNDTPVTVSDMVIGRMSENAGAANRYGIDNSCGGALATANFDATISHLTHDNRATSSNGYARTIGFSSVAPSDASTWTVTDILTGYRVENDVAFCNTPGNVTENIGNAYSLKTDATFEGGGAYNGFCSSTGTVTRVPVIAWNNRSSYDYGLGVGSPEYTAGVGGTAMGARAFRFNRDRLQKYWANALTFDGDFPANFSTGTSNTDGDGDGVMDLFDNCPTVFNPPQYDGDADGKGCACDGAVGGDACP